MLTKDVENVGRAGDVKDVADGYGRNFLLPRRLAIPAGTKASNLYQELERQRGIREQREVAAARAEAARLEGVEVNIPAQANEEDTLFGSITNQDIAAALKAQHRVEIDRHKIDMKEPIRTLGEHEVSLKLHRDVAAHVNVIVTQDR